MNSVEVFNETEIELDELNGLKNLIDYAIKQENVQNVVFNVIIVDKEKIQEINKTYRGIDRVTDVISFALEDNEDVVYEDFRLLGDIYICIDKIFSQAEEYGHSVLRELSFLTIHGFLHLLGYDHMNPEDEKIMFKRQEEILNGYGITR